MSSYATIADMRSRIPEDRLIQLTDDAGTGAADEGVLTRAIEQADNEIDGYVSAYYKRTDAVLPVPPLLTDIAVRVAYYRLFRHGSPTEQVEKDYDRAVSQLRDISKGVIKIDRGEETVPARDGMILVEGPERVASNADLRGFI